MKTFSWIKLQEWNPDVKNEPIKGENLKPCLASSWIVSLNQTFLPLCWRSLCSLARISSSRGTIKHLKCETKTPCRSFFVQMMINSQNSQQLKNKKSKLWRLFCPFQPWLSSRFHLNLLHVVETMCNMLILIFQRADGKCSLNIFCGCYSFL